MIYILPALSKDTNNDHIHGHIKSGHNGQNGKNGQNGHYGMADYGREYSRNWILWKEQEQAGAELCQAQVKLGVIVYIGVKVEVEI